MLVTFLLVQHRPMTEWATQTDCMKIADSSQNRVGDDGDHHLNSVVGILWRNQHHPQSNDAPPEDDIR